MAPQASEKKKRVNKRKSRTEVSSSSSSSESERSSSPTPSEDEQPEPAVNQTESSPEVESTPKKRTVPSNEAFSDFYLRQSTKEFANDLDKLRAANDFNARSVPVLIEALKQGSACFTKDEISKIGQAAGSN